MSFWSHNVELMDEIIEANLPEPWYTQVAEGEIDIYDVPEKIRDKAFTDGEADHWGGLIDAAVMKVEDEQLREALTKDDKPTIDNGGL